MSWGTKGDNVIHTELGAAVSAGKGEKGDIVEVEVPSEQLDIDAGYDDALANVRERRPIPEKPVNENTLKEDYYREIRTRLVLIWIVSNATLGMALTEVYSTGLSGTNGYLKCKDSKLITTLANLIPSHSLGDRRTIRFSIYWIDYVFVGKHRPESGTFKILPKVFGCLTIGVKYKARDVKIDGKFRETFP